MQTTVIKHCFLFFQNIWTIVRLPYLELSLLGLVDLMSCFLFVKPVQDYYNCWWQMWNNNFFWIGFNDISLQKRMQSNHWKRWLVPTKSLGRILQLPLLCVIDNQFISDYLNKPVRANVVPVMFRHCWLLFSCHLHNTHSHHYLLPPFSSKSPSLFFTMISPVLSKDWMTGLNQLGTGRWSVPCRFSFCKRTKNFRMQNKIWHCVSMSAWFCPTMLAKFWRLVGCFKSW